MLNFKYLIISPDLLTLLILCSDLMFKRKSIPESIAVTVDEISESYKCARNFNPIKLKLTNERLILRVHEYLRFRETFFLPIFIIITGCLASIAINDLNSSNSNVLFLLLMIPFIVFDFILACKSSLDGFNKTKKLHFSFMLIIIVLGLLIKFNIIFNFMPSSIVVSKFDP